MRKIISVLVGMVLTLGLAFGLAAPASAHNAYVHNSGASEVRVAVFDGGRGWWLYPGGRTSAVVDEVFVPAYTIVYHYYNGVYQRSYGPGSRFHTGGVYPHTLIAYPTWRYV